MLAADMANVAFHARYANFFRAPVLPLVFCFTSGFLWSMTSNRTLAFFALLQRRPSSRYTVFISPYINCFAIRQCLSYYFRLQWSWDHSSEVFDPNVTLLYPCTNTCVLRLWYCMNKKKQHFCFLLEFAPFDG